MNTKNIPTKNKRKKERKLEARFRCRDKNKKIDLT